MPIPTTHEAHVKKLLERRHLTTPRTWTCSRGPQFLRCQVCIAFNIVALGACLWMTVGPKPAVVQAQQLSAVDQLQNEKIKEMDKHLDSSDQITDKLQSQLNEQGNAITALETEERLFCFLLGLGVTGNFIFQVSTRKKAA